MENSEKFMNEAVNALNYRKSGYGHFEIMILLDDQILSTVTTNSMAIDAAFDDCYDDIDNSGRFYESRRDAQESLVNEILCANNKI